MIFHMIFHIIFHMIFYMLFGRLGLGRATLAIVSTSISFALAFFNSRAQNSAVNPLVITSSIRSMDFPCTLSGFVHRKTLRKTSTLCRGVRFPRGGVYFLRVMRLCLTGICQVLAMELAISAA